MTPPRGAFGCKTGRGTAANPFRHLVYPVPVPGALGVHCTIDLAGRCRFGPDIEWVAEPDYSVQVAPIVCSH